MINHTIDKISSCPRCRIHEGELFRDASMRVRKELTSELKTRAVHDGEILFGEGDKSKGIVFLDTGRIKLSRGQGEKIVLVKIMRPGEILGLGATLTRTPHRVTAEAIDESQVRTIDPRQFRLLLRRNPLFLGAIVDYLEGHPHRELSFQDVSPAVPVVARYLIELAHDDGTRCPEGVCFDLPVTLRELSLVLRMPSDRVAIAINNLEDRQWLYRRRTSVVITDPAALERVAGLVQASDR